MKVTIDRDGCIECGACEDACSDVFVIDDSGKAAIVESFQIDGPSTGDVNDELRSCAEEAADGCPVDVITVE